MMHCLVKKYKHCHVQKFGKTASVNRWHKSHLTLWANIQCQVTYVPPCVFKCPLLAEEHMD
jgi:hypothetical protein